MDGLTLEDVSERSGVARSTLYRHFGTKQELVASAARSCLVEHPTPDTGSLEGDLRALSERFRRDEREHRTLDLFLLLLDATRRDPALADPVTEILDERRRPLRTVLRLAQLRGELDADLDLDAALALILGPFMHRRLVDDAEIDDAFSETVLTTCVAGLRAAHDLTGSRSGS